jgi:hypothetical protein
MQPPAREAGCSERSARIESLSVAAAGGRSPNSRKDCHQLRRRSPLDGACTSRLVLDLKSLLAPVACTCRRSCADGAAGMWARQFSERAGVVCPNQAAEHYYLITGAMPDVDPSWPIIEDPSKCATVAHDLRRTACSTAHAAHSMQHSACSIPHSRWPGLECAALARRGASNVSRTLCAYATLVIWLTLKVRVHPP